MSIHVGGLANQKTSPSTKETERENVCLKLVQSAWSRLVDETKRQWKGSSDALKYSPLVVKRLLSWDENRLEDTLASDRDIIHKYNSQFRRTRLDVLVCMHEEEGRSYAKKNCLFIYCTKDGQFRDCEELIWEIAHELCHAFGAGHSLEGIMSRVYSSEEEFFIDSQAALTLQYTAFYRKDGSDRLGVDSACEIPMDYLTNSFIKVGVNKDVTLKFACNHSGIRCIYFLDEKDCYDDIFNYENEGANNFTLEIRSSVCRLVLIFYNGHREFITLPR